MAWSKRLESFVKRPKISISGMCVCVGGGGDRRGSEIPWIFLYILLPDTIVHVLIRKKTRKPQARQLRVLLKYASRGTKGT
jgi:hypothetical protein